MTISRPWAVAVGGLLGACGVAAAAAASHGGDTRLAAAMATVALAHAPALLALGLVAPQGRGWTIAALSMAVGAVAFCLDMSALIFIGASPVPILAPVSGLLIIAGWLGIAGLAVFAYRA